MLDIPEGNTIYIWILLGKYWQQCFKVYKFESKVKVYLSIITIWFFFFLIDVVMCLYEYNNSSWKFSSQRIYIFCDIRVVVSVAVENFCTQYEAKINTHTTLLNISALNVIPDCQVTLIHITPPDITNLIYWHNGVFKIHCT